MSKCKGKRLRTGGDQLSEDSAQITTSRPATDDADLVQASKAGDSAAFEELVARYDRKLFRIAYHILHNPDDAQDVVQDTFIKVFQNLGQFRADSKFSTWLYRIVVNQSLMELRKQRRKPSTTIELFNQCDEEDQVPIDFSDWRPNPEEQYKESELRELLNRLLMDLRPALRVVFVMHDIEGQSLQETAQALALSVTAAKTRSLRARLYLREQLTAHFRKEAAPKVVYKVAGRPLPNRDSISDAPFLTLIKGNAEPQAVAQAARCAAGGAH
jgi:RNA polymerase sigma-70 factor, ECF subfamily